MRKLLSVFLSLAFVLSSFAVTTPASAAVFILGNDSAMRTQLDTYTNFTIVDTNNSATANGEITSFDYWASNTNPFRFVIVDSSNEVTWISDEIIPGSVGSHSFILTTPATVGIGDNIGMYFAQSGTIPFEFGGDPAEYTPNNNGMPTVGDTLSIEGTSARTYSLVAHADTLNCSTLTLVSDTTTQTGGENAIAVAFIHPAWTASIPGAIWIWEAGPTTVDETVSFEKMFTTAGTILSAQLDIASDNSYEVFIDGLSVATDADLNNFQTGTQDSHDLTSDVTSGTQTLRIDVTNAGVFEATSNPAGLMYKLVVDYCEEPVALDCPAAPSIASHYLKSEGIKPGSSAHKNIISQVAKEMGPQKNFDGVGACDPNYTTTVQSFVESIL